MAVGALLWLFPLVNAQDVQQDSRPLPIYLSDEEILPPLLAVDWQGCIESSDAEDITASVRFHINRDGTVGDAQWSGVTANVQSCWHALLMTLQWHGHPEPNLWAQWTLAARNGVVYSYPTLRMETLTVQPLFLFVSPKTTGAQRKALMTYLETGVLSSGDVER